MEEKTNALAVPASQEIAEEQAGIMDMTKEILADARASLDGPDTMRVPIGELASLGGGVAALCPAFRTVVQDVAFPADGLYRWVNGSVGDTLKLARGGTNWGAFKTADGLSEMAKFQPVAGLQGTASAVMPIDPSTIMVAAALYSIEKELKGIAETGKQILTFLEEEKESEIEADVETLYGMISNYKFNWDNERFVAGNHKMVLDIQRTARKNMIAYQRKVNDVLRSKKPQALQSAVQATMRDLQKKFKYYRLSLYTFSMASLLEILLSGNFGEAYITGIHDEIERISIEYRELFSECSSFLEKKSHASLGTNMLKGVGTTSHAVGKWIGSIPVIRDGLADEFLQNNGQRMKEKAEDIEKNTLGDFAAVSNPGTHVFAEKMTDLIRIYHHTKEICFDREQVYLVTE